MRGATVLLLGGLCAWAPGRTALAQEAFGGAVIHEEKQPDHIPKVTKAPVLVQAVEPVFPPEAQAAGASGDVTLDVQIGEDGRVLDARVTAPAGHGFDEAAVAAVKQFVFTPAEVDGKPASIRISYTQHFVYKEPAPVPDAGVVAAELPVTLKGRVFERGQRKPIGGATVRADGGEETTTAPDGWFTLRLPPGTYDMEVLDSDHLPFKTSEEISAGKVTEVTYFLMPKHVGLYETVVRGDRDKKEVTQYTLEREELEKVPGSFGDPIRVLQDLPGVARAPFISGALIVQGASPNDTGTYFDGVQVPILFHFAGGPSVINPEFVDRIDFFPGGFGAEYGRAIGGIVNIDTRDVTSSEWHGSAKTDLIDTGAFVAAPIAPGWTVSAAARRSYIDLLLDLALRGNSIVVSPVYYDYQLKVTYKPQGSRNTFSLFGFGSNDLLTVDASPNATTTFQINDSTSFQRLVGEWRYRGDRLQHRTLLYVGPNDMSLGLDIIRSDESDVVGGLRDTSEYSLAPWLTLRGGLDIQLTKASFTAYVPPPGASTRYFPGSRPEPTPVSTSAEYDNFPYAEWFETQLLFGPLKLMPSVRAEEYRVAGHWLPTIDPRFVVRDTLWGGPHATVLKGSVGIYHEAPNANLFDPVTGNPNLGLEAAFQTSAGVEQKITDAINLDVTLFYARRFGLAARTSETITEPDGSVQRVNVANLGLGRAYGLELFLKHEITQHFFGWLAYTLSWSDVKNPGDTAYHPSTYDQRHILTLIAQYKFGNGWEVGGRFRLVSGNPTTPVTGATYDADTQSYTPIDGPTNSARLPTFNQLDLRVDRVWLFDRWTFGVYLDVENVYNAANQEGIVYDYRYQGSQVIPSLPILPTFGLKGSF